MIYKLSDLCEFVSGFAFKSKDFQNDGENVIKITHINPPYVDIDGCSHVDITKYNLKKLEKFRIFPGDYVMAMTGATIGKIGRVINGSAYINQRVLKFVPNEKMVNKDYLFYCLTSDDFLKYIFNHIDSESAQANISATTVGEYCIDLPRLEIQNQAAKILSDIDKKIIVNRELCKNLMNKAKLLYGHYFGKSSVFESKKNEWKRASIYEIAEVIYGAPFASKYFNTSEGIPIVRIRDLKEQKLSTYTTENHPKGYKLQLGDIVVGMDGEFRPYFWSNDFAWLNQRVCVFKNKRPKGSMYLFFTLVPQLDFIEKTEAATTVIHIGKNDFDTFTCLLPPNDILNDFEKQTFPLFQLIVNSSYESRKLAALRDNLSKKILSASFDVSKIMEN